MLVPDAAAQSITIGVSTGAVLTEDLGSSRLQLGASVRLRTSSGFGFETGAIHRRLGYFYESGRPGLGYIGYTADAGAWHVPLLLHYSRAPGAVAPFANGGLTIRRVYGGTENGQTCTGLPTQTCSPLSRRELTEVERRTTTGYTIGAGVEFGTRLLSVSPELRFTRWRDMPFRIPVTNANQAEIIIRIAVPVTRTSWPARQSRSTPIAR